MDLLKLLDKVKLTAGEEVIDFNDEGEGISPAEKGRVLIGRWVSKKPLILKAMSQAFLTAWNTRKAFQLRYLGDSKFVVESLSWRDREKVLAESPWHFDRQLVVLVEPKPTDQLSEVNVSRCSFWIRVYDLPFNRRGEGAVQKVAEKAGLVEEVDETSLTSWHSYFRVRVAIEVDKPLIRGTKIRNVRGEVVPIPFRYEKLANFCYFCGRLGHVHEACEFILDEFQNDD